MHGKIVLEDRNDKFFNWEVLDVKDKKIGYLSVNVKHKPQQQNVGIERSNDGKIIPSTLTKRKVVD